MGGCLLDVVVEVETRLQRRRIRRRVERGSRCLEGETAGRAVKTWVWEMRRTWWVADFGPRCRDGDGIEPERGDFNLK